jgi:Tfp pilus assembly protein PilF
MLTVCAIFNGKHPHAPADSPAGKRGEGMPCTPACPLSFRGAEGLRGSAFAMAILALLLPACSGSSGPAAGDASTLADLPGGPRQLAAENFSRGDYGLAERYYREAAEKTPMDAAVWIGLAASYDQLRRFDLADRAYAEAIKLSGETAQILNNQGYSYLLRGNLAAARAKLSKARALEPDNPTLLNNLKLLEASAKYKAP